MPKVHVESLDGNVAVYDNRQAAVAGILRDFDECGLNSIQRVWEEDAEGNEKPLGVHWSVELEELPEVDHDSVDTGGD